MFVRLSFSISGTQCPVVHTSSPLEPVSPFCPVSPAGPGIPCNKRLHIGNHHTSVDYLGQMQFASKGLSLYSDYSNLIFDKEKTPCYRFWHRKTGKNPAKSGIFLRTELQIKRQCFNTS